MELENEINNKLELQNKQNNFFDSFIWNTINTAIDVGLRTILPDLIENQIIDIKNSLFENGLKEGVKTASEIGINFIKSINGIFTGNFENIEQVKIAIENGGILDTISNIIDFSLDKINKKGYINNTIYSLIKGGKNVLLNNISEKLNKELEKQSDLMTYLENNIKDWKKAFNDKDLNSMNEIYINIEDKIDNILPIEKLISEIRQIEEIQNYIKSKGNNFEISELEKEVLQNFSTIK